MSINLSIKGVPEELAAVLRQRAARNHRSLQGELMAILELAARDAPTVAASAAAPAAPSGPAVPDSVLHLLRPLRGTQRIENLVAASRAVHAQPVTTLGNSVDIVRRMRDER